MDVHVLDWKSIDVVSSKKRKATFLVISTIAGPGYAIKLEKKEPLTLGKILVKHGKHIKKR